MRTDVSLKTKLAYKALLFLLWPPLAVIMLALLVVVLVGAWPAIWFLKVQRNSYGGLKIVEETSAPLVENKT